MCGENAPASIAFSILSGSPPRVRGKLTRDKAAGVDARITPACAGKTQGKNWGWVRPEDHPRVCGENFLLTLVCYVKIGSPPRVRGKQERIKTCEGVRRITPACAGKTLASFSTQRFAWDHPRVCGENGLK